MTISFDDVVPEMLRVCVTQEGFRDLKRACLVRDLTGRARLVVEGSRGQAKVDLQVLEGELKRVLGGYFAPPILSTEGTNEQARLARLLLDKSSEWPSYWPSEVNVPLGPGHLPLAPPEWRAVHRMLSKESWLYKVAEPPWPLVEGKTPVILSFYSFKGGVGRTTLLGLVARRLALKGYRVAVVDLDLEAPGISSFLGVPGDLTRGVLDFIVDHVATGSASIEGLHSSAQALSPNLAERVDVFSAGRLDLGFLEKLGRLDFASSRGDATEESSVAIALASLLKQLRSKLEPDFILLDSRAGLHDLGGLSLHALSHLEVLVSRATPQGFAGLELTLKALARRRHPEELECIIVHALAPLPESSELGRQQREQFRDESYRLFQRHVYPLLEGDSPQPSDRSAAHHPWPIGQRSEVELARTIGEISTEALDADDVVGLVQRILELTCAEPDEGKDQEEARP